MGKHIKFSKMHGLGNDFVVIDAISQDINFDVEQIRFMADRHFGIGFDQLLIVEAATSPDADFKYRIFNANGGEVEQCGNGIRCFARFVRDQGLTNKEEITVETCSGLVYPQIDPAGEVSVNMGRPNFQPDSLPFLADEQAYYPFSLAGADFEAGAVSVGNPHVVMLVDDIAKANVAGVGPALCRYASFPNEVNVGFMQVVNRQHIRLRVFERGVGETLACGTGACAAVAIGQLWNILDNEVRVDLSGGALSIRWDKLNEILWMTGPAIHVFEGMIEL